MKTLEEWLKETEQLQRSSHRHGMAKGTPTSQLGVALKIIRVMLDAAANSEVMYDIVCDAAERIINE